MLNDDQRKATTPGSSVLKSLVFICLCMVATVTQAATPISATSPPIEGLVGEAFCFDASLSNSGTTGFGPYYQIVTKPGYTLSSADFIMNPLAITNVGTFPSSAPFEVTDPLSETDVTGPADGELYTIQFPIGSLVTGQPALNVTLCFDVDSAEVVNVAEPNAFELVPVYQYGDTATGANGPEFGTRDSYNFTPREIVYSISDSTAEMERPPGPAWAWDIEIIANIASDRTVNPIDFGPIEPITLPPNVQFLGPVTFTGSGVTCTATTPPGGSPGGDVTLDCIQGTGTIGNDEDIVVTFPVYIIDTLDPNSCTNDSAINTAKHLTIQKSATQSGIPGSTISYSIRFDVSEFVDGITDLSVEDILPDGMTYVDAPMLTYGGSTTTLPHVIANDTPSTGETQVTYDVTAATGNLAAADTGLITYTATIDQTYDGTPLAGQPLRSRDRLTNSVIGTYDIENGIADCTDDSSATVTVDNVTISKTLVSPANGLVQAGDPVTWRLTLDIPSGDVQGITFTDYFPLPVVNATTIDTTTGIAANTDIVFGPAHNAANNGNPIDAATITANAGENSLTIAWQDVIATTPQVIEVDITAVISNEPFADGIVLSNVVQAKTDNSGVDNSSGIQISQITLQQPLLTVDKSVVGSTTGYEAGDDVIYNVTITNDGSAPAYDVRVVDTPDTELTNCTVTNTTGASGGTPNNMFGAGYDIPTFSGATNNAIDPGDNVVFAVTCTVALTASNNDTLENTVNAQWAAQPGATTFPPEEDSAEVRTAQAQVFKEIVTTSEAVTDDTTADTSGDRRPVVAGEIIRYRAWAFIPQGTLSSVAIRDLLPTGLEYVAGQTFIALLSDTLGNLSASSLACASGTSDRSGNDSTDLSSLILDCPIEPSSGGSGSGSDPIFNLVTVTNSEDDGNEELIVIEFNAVVLPDVATTTFANRMRLNTANGNPQSGLVYAEQQIPALTVLKTVSPTSADGEDTVEYTITVRHTDPDSEFTAYDIRLTDIVPAGLTYDSVTGIAAPNAPANPGTESCVAPNLATDDSTPSASPGLVITFDQLVVGDACEFHFFAETSNGIAPGQTITNTANIAYDSLPGTGTDAASNGTGSAPGTQEAYTGSADADLSIEAVELAKSIVTTTIPETSDVSADTLADPRQLVLGETLRYRLQMRLPEGDADDFVVTDNLPTGLQYVANTARLALVYDFGGGAITATPAIVCASGTLDQAGNETTISGISPNCALEPTGGPFGNGTDLVWDLGDLMNSDMDANQEFVVFEFDAQVLDTTSNRAGAIFSNDYTLSLDSGASTTTSNTAVAEAEVPAFGLAKSVLTGPINNADGTYTFTYRFTVQNEGSLPVANVQVADDLGTTFSGVTFAIDTLTSPTLSVVTLPAFNGVANQNLLSGTDTIAANSSHSIDLKVTVTPGANFGTFNNTATTTAQLPGGSSLSDTSDNGPDADDDGNGDPTNDSDVTPVTLGEDPELGVAKTISAGPTNNGDGTYTLTYSILVENSGDVNLAGVQVTDNLSNTFATAESFVVDTLTSPDFTVNVSGFTGIAPNNTLLTGADTLAPATSGNILLTVTVTPGSGTGPHNNTVVGNATSPANTPVTDTSDNGTVPDGNGDNDPTNDSDPTSVTFGEAAEIGLAKRVSAGPTNNGDGTYSLTYTLFVENTGDTELRNLQVVDNLTTTFAGVTSISVDSVTSAEFALATTTYNGVGNNNLLLGTETLAVNASGSIAIAVTITPGNSLGPHNNMAEAQSTSPSGIFVTDISHDGSDPDGDGDGDPTNDSEPTPVTFEEMALVGIAKAVILAPVNNGDGTFTLTYRLTAENFGDVQMNNVQVDDDLVNSFSLADAFVVDSKSAIGLTVNPAYTGIAPNTNLLIGTDSLAVDATATIDIEVTVTPGANLGPYNNKATITATSPAGTTATDDSQAGGDPDSNGNDDPTDDTGPTPVSFVEGVSIGLAKTISAGPVNNGDGTFTLTYQLRAENTGLIVVNSLQITEALSTTFAGASAFVVDDITSPTLSVDPTFTGLALNQSLLDGTDTLAVGAFATVDLTVTVTPGATLNYNNSAMAMALSPGGDPVEDTSDDGLVVDQNGNNDATDDSDPTPVTFSENGSIGLAKLVTAGPTNNEDGTYSLTYRIRVENTGSIVANSTQITESLATTFASATSFTINNVVASAGLTLNPGFDGNANSALLAGTDNLNAAAAETIDLSITVTPGSVLGPYNNTATVTATTPGGAPLTDESDDNAGVDENGNGDPTDDNDPTVVTFDESPVLGIAKAVLTGPINNEDGTYGLTYRLIVTNTGDVDVNALNVTENLATTFAGVTSFAVDNITVTGATENPGYNGTGSNLLLTGSDTLAVGSQVTVDIEMTVTPGSNFGPYNNTATATGQTPAGTALADDSTDGANPDPDNNGNPGDNQTPTPLTFAENSVIGLAKAASAPSTPNYDGTFTSTITLVVANLGDVLLNNVVVTDNVASEIVPASVTAISNLAVTGSLSALNPTFDGVAVTDITDGSESLAVGEQATITFDMTFNPNDNIGPFNNQASVNAESPGNPNPGTPNVTDLSTDGPTPDADGNNDPTDDETPTPIVYVAGSSCTLQMPTEIIPGQAFSIGVEDSDSFYDSAAVDTLQVIVRNTVSGEMETVTLVESGNATGSFAGSLTVNYDITTGPDDDGTLFAQHADTITSTHTDVLNASGGVTDCTASGELLGLATLEGMAWLDSDTDDNFDPGEAPLDGWMIEVYQNGILVGTVPVNPDGSYRVPNLIPGGGYEVRLIHPTSNATFGQIEDITLPPQTTVLDQNMPIDPSGVFYDSVTRDPIEGVTATMVNDSGTPLPAACLLPGQQNQISGADGYYRFDLVADADPACPSGGTYTIVVAEPAEYNPGYSALLPPLAGPLDPTGLGSPVRLGEDSTAPTLGDTTDYYVNFTLANGDPDVVWNHIPLDPFGVGGFSVRLTKDADRPTTSVGGLVSYTITLENLSTVTIPGISVEDRIPAGFTFVPESATLDGIQGGVAATGTRPVTFAGITLNSGQRRVLRYLLRAGAGVVRGEYINTATPYVGPAQIGNTDTATVMVVADPDFEETTIIGKVWNDRDEDGWQDASVATQLQLEVDFARGSTKPEQKGNSLVALGDEIPRDSGLQLALGVKIKSLAGRYGLGDFSGSNQVTITSYYQQPVQVSEVRLRTKEGTRLFAKADESRQKHVGAVKRGRSSQNIDLGFHQERTDQGYALIITLTNNGLDEPGLPGVRLATVEGLLIETDAFGRYHIAGVDAGFVERGRNFIVKVDPATLPKQTKFVTENPRVKRLSQGLMNQFDFGVHLPENTPPQQRVRVKVAEMFFAPGSAQVLPEYKAQLRELVKSLARGTAITLEMHSHLRANLPSSAAQNLAKARAQALQREIRLMRGDKSAIDIQLDLTSTKRADEGRSPTQALKTMGDQR